MDNDQILGAWQSFSRLTGYKVYLGGIDAWGNPTWAPEGVDRKMAQLEKGVYW